MDHDRDPVGLPPATYATPGTKATSAAVLIWLPDQGVGGNYIAPDKSQQAAFVKGCNGKSRDECLNDMTVCPPGESKFG